MIDLEDPLNSVTLNLSSEEEEMLFERVGAINDEMAFWLDRPVADPPKFKSVVEILADFERRISALERKAEKQDAD